MHRFERQQGTDAEASPRAGARVQRAADHADAFPHADQPVALTVAAQVATLPVVLGSFERLSLVAPLANVAVVPLVPLVMAACALAAPAGLLVASFAGGPAGPGRRTAQRSPG